MVADNGDWNYCSSILRRKGRKRWLPPEKESTSHRGPKNLEKFPYYHFLLGSRLQHSKRHKPGSCQRIVSFRNILSQIFRSDTTLNVNCMHYFFILFLSLSCLSLFPSASAATQVYRQKAVSSREIICSSLDIRNTVESFKQLTDCRVIEGFLQIVLMDRTNESDFVNLTFPKLREITGYLLLYRVNGLKSLATLFPNLSVIRGQDLFINYALAVYEMLHLQELGLHSLTDITRGYVFITKNPLLCYFDTIDWSRILNPHAVMDANLIFENRQGNACPKCPSFDDKLCGYNNQTKQSLCWNNQYCQKTCPDCNGSRCSDSGECCASHCLGGCISNECFACEKVVLNSQCMEKCPNKYYEFKERRCITENECYDMPRPREDAMALQMRPYPYKPHMGKCIIECPQGFGETAFTNDRGQKQYKCEKCTGICRKVCDAANVDSIQSAQKLKGCVIINGSLEIQIRGGGNIVKELEHSLNMIEEITGYLKIVRSPSLFSLDFLQKLKLIRGDNLENGKYVLVVLDNQHLTELWDFSRREADLAVSHGRMFFHFNPKLCLHKIIELQRKLNITQVDNLEVAPNSNGDKVACNITALNVSIQFTRHDMVLVTWVPYTHYEMRTLLGYVIYYMEAPANMNVSMNDVRGHSCGGDGWNTFDVEVPELPNEPVRDKDNITSPILHLKPYTRYAYYVKTYTIATETNGAQSRIQYFRTSPATPTPPRQLKVTATSSTEILIHWQPPEQPNGKLVHYIVTADITDGGDKLLEKRNYCNEPMDSDKKESQSTKEEFKKLYVPVPEKKDECLCQPAVEAPSKIKKNDEEVQALIEFENRLQDNIYVKYTHTSSNSTRTKRDTANMQFDLNGNGLETLLLSNEGNATVSKNSSRNGGNVLRNDTVPEHFRQVVDNNTLELKITNLKHFSEYSISVQACREKLPNEPPGARPTDCSTGKMETVQTLPLEEADKIDPASIEIEILNDTTGVRLKWEKPTKTNGQILTYLIQYKRVDEYENQQAQTQCITSHDFEKNGKQYNLVKLHPGNYSVILKATSLTKDIGNNYTPARYFYIQEADTHMVPELMLGALFAVCIIIVILVILLVTIRYVYPDSWYHRKLLFATVNPEYFKPVEGYDKWEISRRKIVFDNLLGIGHFGEVYEGRAKGILEKGVTTKIAIKTLNNSPTSHRTWMSFLNEASVMKQFDTHHVVRLLGVVTKGEPLVLMELMARGDLRTYLKCCREDVPEEERKGPLQAPPTLKEILQMAAEIADGMLYLSDKKFVHRDLAARNCMMNAIGTVKVGDFGLTRDVYETDYYRKDSRGHLPVRWMAPESLRDGIFTSRSDVWSYGIVLWEMSTLASLPYTGLGNGEVMPYVINGGVMEEPENCPAILSEIMKVCWQYKYSQRPAFSEILEILLPNVRADFADMSYYHTDAARQLRMSNAEAVAEDDTPYTPLRIMEDFEDFSLDSDDENEDEEANEEQNDDVDNEEADMANEANTSGANVSIRSLSTVNGYIRRPHSLLPVTNTKTTPC